jgi:hypothetical protein
MPPWAQHQKVLVLRIVRLQGLVLNLRPEHIFLVVVAAHGQRGHGTVFSECSTPRDDHTLS